MAAVAATITPRTSVREAHRLLREHGFHHLPVLDGDLLVGIVSHRDLLRAESDVLPIRDTMSRTIFVLSPETLVSRAARIFRGRRLAGAPGRRGTVARGGAPRGRRPRDGVGPSEVLTVPGVNQDAVPLGETPEVKSALRAFLAGG